MTYLLGARCKDGVVLLGDRKFTIDYGADETFDDKITGEIPGILTGFSGTRRMFERFRAEIRNYVTSYYRTNKDNVSTDLFLIELSDIMNNINNKFGTRDENFDLLAGMSGTNFADQKSRLFYFYDDGSFEPVNRYKAIGSGWPYGMIYLKELWKNNDISIDLAAETGYFIVKYIESYGLNNTVGLEKEGKNRYPQIHFLPDNQSDYPADEGKLEQLLVNVKKRLNKVNVQNQLIP
jgi:20S proteasome alpha/beta subunit